eukprot:gene3711-4624_t
MSGPQSRQFSSKQIASHTKLKTRHDIGKEEQDRDNKLKNLQDREQQKSIDKRNGGASIDDEEANKLKNRLIRDQEDEEHITSTSTTTTTTTTTTTKRAEQQKRKEMEAAKDRESERQQRLAQGNPLLNGEGSSDYSMKKKWFDDGIFKNQAKDEPVLKKRFINDTTRNDFAKKFLTKYIK